MENVSFDGRQVMVFGAAGALGAGVAEAFAAAGASVTGVDRAEPQGDRRLAGIRYQAANVLDDGAVGALFDSAPAPGPWSTPWAGSPASDRSPGWTSPS